MKKKILICFACRKSLLNLPLLFFTLLFTFYFSYTKGQNNIIRDFDYYYQLLDDKYGNDPFLVNGIRNTYSYYKYAGHPYYGEDEFKSSGITIKGKQYYNIPLKFDIYHHRLIYSYKNAVGGQEEILLNNELIDSFVLNNDLFISKKNGEEEIVFYHVRASAGQNRFLSSYSKKIKIISSNSADNFEFTKIFKTLYLLRNNGELIKIRKWSDLKKVMSIENYRKMSKTKNLKFKLKLANNNQLASLLTIIESLENN